MKTKFRYVFFILLLFVVHCSEDKIPVKDEYRLETGYGKLLIDTDSTTYSWRKGETRDYVFVGGTIENQSDTTFYSRLGDGFGPPEQEELSIAANSEGYVEKYDESHDSWFEIDVLPLLIEGSRFVPIKPSKDYTIHAPLEKDSDEDEMGTYRIRVNYYEVENPDSTISPFQDFSNVFEIH